jgi:hypothetical protein
MKGEHERSGAGQDVAQLTFTPLLISSSFPQLTSCPCLSVTQILVSTRFTLGLKVFVHVVSFMHSGATRYMLVRHSQRHAKTLASSSQCKQGAASNSSIATKPTHPFMVGSKLGAKTGGDQGAEQEDNLSEGVLYQRPCHYREGVLCRV